MRQEGIVSLEEGRSFLCNPLYYLTQLFTFTKGHTNLFIHHITIFLQIIETKITLNDAIFIHPRNSYRSIFISHLSLLHQNKPLLYLFLGLFPLLHFLCVRQKVHALLLENLQLLIEISLYYIQIILNFKSATSKLSDAPLITLQ